MTLKIHLDYVRICVSQHILYICPFTENDKLGGILYFWKSLCWESKISLAEPPPPPPPLSDLRFSSYGQIYKNVLQHTNFDRTLLETYFTSHVSSLNFELLRTIGTKLQKVSCRIYIHRKVKLLNNSVI